MLLQVRIWGAAGGFALLCDAYWYTGGGWSPSSSYLGLGKCTKVATWEQGNAPIEWVGMVKVKVQQGNEVNTALWRSDAENALNDSTVACLERSATEA